MTEYTGMCAPYVRTVVSMITNLTFDLHFVQYTCNYNVYDY